MPSILPGYEYDIFISYRHNDNQYDGWVSEFVEKLRKELVFLQPFGSFTRMNHPKRRIITKRCCALVPTITLPVWWVLGFWQRLENAMRPCA
jgi:hypothetical protein